MEGFLSLVEETDIGLGTGMPDYAEHRAKQHKHNAVASGEAGEGMGKDKCGNDRHTDSQQQAPNHQCGYKIQQAFHRHPVFKSPAFPAADCSKAPP